MERNEVTDLEDLWGINTNGPDDDLCVVCGKPAATTDAHGDRLCRDCEEDYED